MATTATSSGKIKTNPLRALASLSEEEIARIQFGY
jgi:hypothetical protein